MAAGDCHDDDRDADKQQKYAEASSEHTQQAEDGGRKIKSHVVTSALRPNPRSKGKRHL